jgi:ankyrin repeat protein
VAELLLAHGADVNATNNAGWTPLHLAAKNGCKDEIELLLANKAAINATNNGGQTQLGLTAGNRFHRAIIELLRQHGGHE